MENQLSSPAARSPFSSQPIEALYLGCFAQNPRTQRELFERLYPKMLSLSKRYVKDAAAAEDVLLIAFRKVFDRIGQFRQMGSFEGWIRRIVVNECLMHLDKESRRKDQCSLEKINYPAHQAGPEDPLNCEDLIKLIGQLPKGYRRVFEYFVIEGLSHEEIAKQLCISESTSKSQLSRARILLQRRLHLRPHHN